MGNLVSVKNLIKYYGKNLVIDNANIDIEENKIIGLLGPNGCGKTTIMKILAGLISDYSGEVLIDGKKPGAETKAIVSFLPDHSAVPEWMSVRQIIDYYADFFADFDSDKAEKIAERFALKPNIKYKAMSKGMQERLQIDLAISRRARLYLLDEPLGESIRRREAPYSTLYWKTTLTIPQFLFQLIWCTM